jgi:hypothetical protein
MFNKCALVDAEGESSAINFGRAEVQTLLTLLGQGAVIKNCIVNGN